MVTPGQIPYDHCHLSIREEMKWSRSVSSAGSRRTRRRRQQQPPIGSTTMNDMMQAMQQLQAMQQKMAETQSALETKTVTEETGGGAVRATMTGMLRLTKLEIKPEAIDPADPAMLEDLVLTAVNKALESAKAMAERDMEAATAGMMPF
jgi:DNA-binding YbaB/EbfC family protein